MGDLNGRFTANSRRGLVFVSHQPIRKSLHIEMTTFSKKFTAIALIWLLAASSTHAQDLRFDHIGIDNGLSQGSVISLLHDDLGWLWVGTEDGLNRYDGYNFRVYRHDPSDPTSLGSGYTTAIYKDQSGDLWVGTSGGGLKSGFTRPSFTRNYAFGLRRGRRPCGELHRDHLQNASGAGERTCRQAATIVKSPLPRGSG